MSDIEYLVGNREISNEPMQTLGDTVIEFASEFSNVLMKSPLARQYPDISALAFWCRRANLTRLKAAYPDAIQRIGKGLCFHIAPSNIPVSFAFSLFFGLLAGNANIVRLPSKSFPQVEPICVALKNTLENFPEVKKRVALIRYPVDCGETERLSGIADVRMIWGGDQTVSKLKLIPTGPRCLDIAFADRYSVCIIDGEAILSAPPLRIKRLAEDFYNDTWLMDQNACSSPQLIMWENDSPAARDLFWNTVCEVASSRYVMQAAVSVDKYTHMCEDAINNEFISNIERCGSILYRAQVVDLHRDMERLRGYGGYFYEYSLKSRSELAKIINEKYQTITYFGVDPVKLREWTIVNHLRGIDRIVPVGKAMDIGVIWDGYDLIRMLSRIVAAE